MKNISLTLICLLLLLQGIAQVDLLTEINPGTSYTPIRNLTKFQGKAFFFTAEGSSSTAVWWLYKSDGTPAGTEIVYASDSIALKNAARVTAICNNKMYFITKTDYLWVTDGTTAGTLNLGQIHRNDTVQLLTNIAASGNNYVFLELANKGLARVNAQTNAIDTFYNSSTNCGIIFSRNGRAFTDFDPYSNSTETGIYDLNQSKFLLTKSVDSFSLRQYPLSTPGIFLQFLNNDEFIAVSQGSNSNPVLNVRVFKYNLTNNTKTLLAELPENSLFVANNMVTAGGKVFFGISKALSTGNFQKRGLIYVTDGTVAGTDTIKITGKYTTTRSSQERALGDKVLFVIDGLNALSDRTELWITDGTQSGTTKLYHCPDTLAGISLNFTYASEGTPTSDTLNGLLYFENNSHELWRTDGTIAGTQKFCNLSVLRYFDNILTINDKLFFDAQSPVCVGTELWVTDGTGSCTVDVSCPASVNDPQSSALKAFPNPATDRLTVEVSSLKGLYSLTLLSADGRMVAQQHNLSATQHTFPLSSVPDGIYLLQVHTTERYYTQKIIVQH